MAHGTNFLNSSSLECVYTSWSSQESREIKYYHVTTVSSPSLSLIPPSLAEEDFDPFSSAAKLLTTRRVLEHAADELAMDSELTIKRNFAIQSTGPEFHEMRSQLVILSLFDPQYLLLFEYPAATGIRLCREMLYLFTPVMSMSGLDLDPCRPARQGAKQRMSPKSLHDLNG